MTTILVIIILAIIITGAVSHHNRGNESARDILRRNDPLNPDYRLDRIRDREQRHRDGACKP